MMYEETINDLLSDLLYEGLISDYTPVSCAGGVYKVGIDEDTLYNFDNIEGLFETVLELYCSKNPLNESDLEWVAESVQGIADFNGPKGMNLPTSITGLPDKVWIDQEGKDRKNKHYEPRIKFRDKDSKKWFPVQINDPMKPYGNITKIKDGLKKLGFTQQWITKNREALIKLWNKEIDIKEFINLVEKV